MAKKIIFSLIPALLLIFLIVVLFRPYFFQGKVPIPGDILIGHYHPWVDKIWEGRLAGYPIKNFILFDGIRQTLPWRLLAIEQIKVGQWPLWNPYILGGMPLLGNLQTAIVYPLNFLFFLLPELDAWSVYIILQPFLAGLFAFFFLRTLSCSRKAALLGGVTYGFSLIMMNHLEFGIDGHTALWLPLALGAVNKIQQQNQWRWGLLLSLAVLMTLLGGYPPPAIYNLIIIGFYWLYKIRPIFSRKSLIFIFALILAFLISMPQILPAFELAQKVIRDQTQFGVLSNEAYFFPFENLIMVIAPDFFGHPATNNFFSPIYYSDNPSVGIVGFIFVCFSSLWLFRKKEISFWLLVAIIPMLLMLETPLGKVLRHIPFSAFSLVTPMRMIWVVSFALAVLAGLGLDVFANLVAKKRFWSVFLPLIIVWELLFLVWIASFLIPGGEHIQISQRNLILPTFFLGTTTAVLIFSLFFPRLWPFMAGLIILLSGTELVRQGIKYNPFLSKDLVFPQTEILKKIQSTERTWRTLITHPELIPVNSNTPYHLPMVDGYASIYDGRSGQMVHLANAQLPLSTIESYPRVVFQTEYQSPLIDLLNLKYVLALKELKDEKLELIMKEGETLLYENKNVLSKAFFVQNYKVFPNDIELANEILKGDLSKEVFLEKEPGLKNEEIKVGEVKIVDYQDNQITLRTENEGQGILVLTDSFDNGWQVFIGDLKAEVLRANFNLRAIVVPEGRQEINFVYRPKSFKIGLYLSEAALLLLIFSSLVVVCYKKRKK